MSKRRSWIVAAALLLLLSGLQPVGPARAEGKTICVDPHDTECFPTIEDAIDDWNTFDGDVILISADTYYTQTIRINKSVVLRGTRTLALPPFTTTIRGTGSIPRSLIEITSGETVTLETLRITGGTSGGVFNWGGTLLMNDVLVDHNSGVIGAGVSSIGILRMVDCQVEYNQVLENPDAVVVGGGGIHAKGRLFLSGTDVTHNVAVGYGGGIRVVQGTFDLTDSNISDNTATLSGGGLYADSSLDATSVSTMNRVTIDGNQSTGGDGGGLYLRITMAELENVTLSGNSASAGKGGAIYFETVTYRPKSLRIGSSTLAGNRALANQGAGIAEIGPATVNIYSTILADNAGDNCAVTAPATLQSWDYNLSDDNTCYLPWHADLVDTEAMLNPLALNSPGRVKTHALQIGSPADNLLENCLGTDARGVPRGQPLCDSGAYEGTEPAKSPQAGMSAVAVKRAVCRFGPGTIYQAIGYLSPGETHAITGRNLEATWLRLETCWVAARLLKTDADLELIPVLIAPPTPTPKPTTEPRSSPSCSSYSDSAACNTAGCKWVVGSVPGGYYCTSP
jgi:predicted outer membrane repeat protein